MTKLDTTMAWTTSSDPTARAKTWAMNPAICSAPPRTHTGWRNSWIKKRELSPGALVRSAPRCCMALPSAKAQAATKARKAAIPNPWAGYARDLSTMAGAMCIAGIGFSGTAKPSASTTSTVCSTAIGPSPRLAGAGSMPTYRDSADRRTDSHPLGSTLTDP
jgi:hypothetical protein